MLTAPLDTPQVIFLGIGILSWPEVEQKTGRYAFVGLHVHLPQPALFMPQAIHLVGLRGKLRAIILRNFQRKYHPGTSAPVTSIIELGVGTVFCEDDTHIGLWPTPYRDLAWLDPEKLQLCAEQEVRLEFSKLDFMLEPTP